MPGIFKYINLDYQSRSKKDAIVDGILTAIEKNEITKGDPLPSVNKFIGKLGVARMTVVKALNVLKERGIIVAEDKVGFFVKDANIKRELKVFLFLNGFNSYQEILYNKIIEQIIDPNITIDLYFHHCNPVIFKSILQENLGSYGLYAITALNHPSVNSLLSRIPKSKLLQIIRPPVLEGISSISQDFYEGLKKSLSILRERLEKYDRFILVFPSNMGHPEEIKTAFTQFCIENNIAHSIVKKVRKDLIEKGTAFWVIEDSHLISLIKIGEEMGFQLGEEIGILSYNETPMKQIIRNGITVISVDFAKMGQSIAEYIINPSFQTKVFSPEVIFRKSL
jgi:DNA-binding transcriptional regulator YhcF (GntR family)